VDRDGKVILDNNMKPIVVGPQAVLNARGAVTQEQIKAELEAANASRAAYLTGTNQLGQVKPRIAGGKTASIKNVSRSINQLLDAQRERARQLAGQK